MSEVPLPVIIGLSMILVGIILGVYVLSQALSPNRKGDDLLR
jgi:hypothetical protein